MEINGIAHIFLTASNYERSRDFYRKLLPFLGLKCATLLRRMGGAKAIPITPSAQWLMGFAFAR
jgi:hypothetical protein